MNIKKTKAQHNRSSGTHSREGNVQLKEKKDKVK